MKLTPTTNTQTVKEISIDLAEFTRKIRQAEYFHDTENEDDSLVRNKTHFLPPKSRNQVLNSFIKIVENIPLKEEAKSNII